MEEPAGATCKQFLAQNPPKEIFMRRCALLAVALAFVVASVLGCGDSGPKVEKGKNPFQERNEAYKEMHKEKGKVKDRGGILD